MGQCLVPDYVITHRKVIPVNFFVSRRMEPKPSKRGTKRKSCPLKENLLLPDDTKTETETPSLPSKLDDQAARVENIILEAKLENKQRELEETKQREKYARKC